MHMVGHKNISMNEATVCCRRIIQRVQVMGVILFVKEYGLPVDAACYDMLWNIGNEVSELARHTRIINHHLGIDQPWKMSHVAIYSVRPLFSLLLLMPAVTVVGARNDCWRC